MHRKFFEEMETVKLITIEAGELEEKIRKAVSDALKNYFPKGMPTSNNAREEDQLIGTDEACKILGCCSRTMQNYRDRKCFSVVKVGPHKALYYRSEILAFRDAHRVIAK